MHHSKFLYSSNILQYAHVDLRDWLVGYEGMYPDLYPPKPLDQSKNVTVRTIHIWPGIVHEHIFLALATSVLYFSLYVFFLTF